MGLFDGYATDGYYDEMFAADGSPRPHYAPLLARMRGLTPENIAERQRLADLSFMQQGVTFTVYGDEAGTEKTFPFDLLPRVLPASEWATLERGLTQRLIALNRFLHDLYHDQKVLNDKVVPRELIDGAAHFLPEMAGTEPPGGVYIHIAGSDLIRDVDGRFLVLEDNLRTPSGVSYVLMNRQVLMHVFPALFQDSTVRSVAHYASQLLSNLRALAPGKDHEPTIALLTPGVYNSAYFEHTFLAQQLGIELVEGSDLTVDRHDRVYMKTTRGLKQVDVLYRRVDDAFLDPEVFLKSSVLGVPGLMRAYKKGNITLANAVGTGVADDKAIYAYVPKIIQYYLGEDPILPNVETFLASEPSEISHILANLDKFVVKAANESGGYGMLMGPMASKSERAEFAGKIKANPRNYIAQPLIHLSRSPAYLDGAVQGRHVDLRPFALVGPGEEITIVPGGLTRVALKKGSYVVNSSQGGGSKDTWVVEDGGKL